MKESAEQGYQIAWTRYQWWKKLLSIAELALMALFLLAVVVATYLVHQHVVRKSFVVAGVAPLFFASGCIHAYYREVKLKYFRCPRCGNWFSVPGKWFTAPRYLCDECVHCHLKLYEVPKGRSVHHDDA